MAEFVTGSCYFASEEWKDWICPKDSDDLAGQNWPVLVNYHNEEDWR
jgi:hypothetical protein